ncbi:MAG: hypothetical protein ACRD2G_09460 [Terriglobia bacterium]
MPADTRIAALVFVVPFTIAVCIVAVETELSASASFTGFLILARNFTQPEDHPEDRDDC